MLKNGYKFRRLGGKIKEDKAIKVGYSIIAKWIMKK